MTIKLPPENQSREELEKYISDTVWPAFEDERNRLKLLNAWARGKQPEPQAIRKNNERRVLQRMARAPWMRLMVSTFAQQLIVDGYRRAGTNQNAAAWETWLRNDMPSQQFALNRAVVTYGYTYLRITRGTDELNDGRVMAVMKGASPLRTFALYEDPYADQWPKYVLEALPDDTYRWWDDFGYYPLENENGKFRVTGSFVEHDYGHPPFVRYLNEIDLEGRAWGEVEPVIELAMRIDKTAFDRLLVQHFNSFKVRWATGLEQPSTEEEVEQEKIRISNEEILISSVAEARFGTLEETTMDSFIEAYKADLQTFLAVTQLPPTIIGQLVNVAADALAAGTRSTVQKLIEKQTTLGASHNQAMAFVNLIEGREDEANDPGFGVHWEDVEIKSLAQFADAWGKMVEQLGIPKWGVWPLIPGIDQNTVEGWKEGYFEQNRLVEYLRDVHGQKQAGPALDDRGGPNSAQNTPSVRNDNGEPKAA